MSVASFVQGNENSLRFVKVALPAVNITDVNHPTFNDVLHAHIDCHRPLKVVFRGNEIFAATTKAGQVEIGQRENGRWMALCRGLAVPADGFVVRLHYSMAMLGKVSEGVLRPGPALFGVFLHLPDDALGRLAGRRSATSWNWARSVFRNSRAE